MIEFGKRILISSAFVRSLPFLSFVVLVFAWNVPWYLQFTWRDLIFLILLFSSISLSCSLNAFLSLLSILWNSAFSWVYLSLSPFFYTSLLSSVICKAFSDNHFAFLHFFFFGMVLFAASYTILWTSVHSSLGTPFTRSNSLNLFITSTVYL